MKKIYIAGFDVFYPNAIKRFSIIREKCKKAGFIGLTPIEDEDLNDNDTSATIFTKCITRIDDSIGVIANLNSFRGSEPDSGTCFEVGYAYALGKLIVGYTDIVNWHDHVCSYLINEHSNEQITKKYTDNEIKCIADTNKRFMQDSQFEIENYGLPLNLMLSKCGIIIHGTFDDALSEFVKHKS